MRIVLKYYPNWGAGPERFLGLVQILDQALKAEPELNGISEEELQRESLSGAALELGNLLIQALPLHLGTFTDMIQINAACCSGIDPVNELRSISNQASHDDRLSRTPDAAAAVPSYRITRVEALADSLTKEMLTQVRRYVELV